MNCLERYVVSKGYGVHKLFGWIGLCVSWHFLTPFSVLLLIKYICLPAAVLSVQFHVRVHRTGATCIHLRKANFLSCANCHVLRCFSLKMECEKLAQEKTEMQRHYVMVSTKYLASSEFSSSDSISWIQYSCTNVFPHVFTFHFASKRPVELSPWTQDMTFWSWTYCTHSRGDMCCHTAGGITVSVCVAVGVCVWNSFLFCVCVTKWWFWRQFCEQGNFPIAE